MHNRLPFFIVVGILLVVGLVTHITVDANRKALDFVHTGDHQTTKELISSGLDVNKSGEMGSTPLMQAARSGDAAAVKALLESKANVDAKDRAGRTAVHWAIYMYRLSKKDRYTDVAKHLLDSGADVNLRDSQKRTYLMGALEAGNMTLARSLVDRGIEVQAADVNGTTALMCAMRGALTGDQVTEACRLLISKGADPGAKNRGGQTAFDMAKRQKDQQTREAGMKALAKTKRA